MRERVGLLGGRLEVGPTTGGFLVRAHLPAPANAPANAPASAPAGQP
jgi:signal transduction histidine kinase